MAKGRKAELIQTKLGMVIYGDFFTGKSTLASQFAYFKRPDGKPFRVLYLDPESGSIDDYLEELKNNGVDLANIYILYTQSLAEVRQYIAKVKNNEDIYELDDDGNETDDILLDADGEPFRADALVVDGTTILNLTTKQGLVEFSKKRNTVKADKDNLIGDARLVKIEGAGLELKDYNTINFKGNDLILDLLSCGVHWIATAREADEQVSIKNDDGSTSRVATGKKIPEGFKGLGYNAKTVIRMFRDEDGQVCAHIEKDRTHVHKDNEIIEDPSLLDWQVVVDKTAKNKAFTLKNDLTKAVEVEQDLYAKEVLGSVGSPVKADTSNTSNADELESLRKAIIEKRNALPANEKSAMKAKLEKEGLPTAYKNVTDVEVLKKVLKAFD